MKIEGAHRQILVDLIKAQVGNPVLGVEVGVHRGKTSRKLLDEFRNMWLVLVDTWPDEAHRKSAIESVAPHSFRAQFVRGESTATKTLSRVDDEEADFVFIDADHSYEAVQQDIAAWWPKVKPGGLFCGHDYGKPDYPGVQKAVDEWAKLIGVETETDLLGHIWWTKKPAK